MKFLAFILLVVVAFVAAEPTPDPQYLRYSSGLPLVYSSPSVYSRVVASPYTTYSRSGLYYGNGIYDGLGARVYAY